MIIDILGAWRLGLGESVFVFWGGEYEGWFGGHVREMFGLDCK